MEDQLQKLIVGRSEETLKEWENIQTIVQLDNAIKQLKNEMLLNEQQGIKAKEEEKTLLESLEMDNDLKRVLSLKENGIQLEMMEMIIEQKKKWEATKSISEALNQLSNQLKNPEMKKSLLAYQLSIVSTFDHTKRVQSIYETTKLDRELYTVGKYQQSTLPLSEEEKLQIESTMEYHVAREEHNTKTFDAYLDQLWGKIKGKSMTTITEWGQVVIGLIEDGTLPNLLPEERVVQIVEKLKENFCSNLGIRCQEYLEKKKRGEPLGKEFPQNQETYKFYQRIERILDVAKKIEQYEETYKYKGVFIKDTKLFDVKDSPFEEFFLSKFDILKVFFDESEKVEREKLEQLNQTFIDQDYSKQLKIILDPQNEEKYHTNWHVLIRYLEAAMTPFLKRNNPNVEGQRQNVFTFTEEKYTEEELKKLKELLEACGKNSPFQQLDNLRELQIEQAQQLYKLTTEQTELERKIKRALFLFEFLYDQQAKQTFLKYFENIYGKSPKRERENETQIKRYERLDHVLLEEAMSLFEDDRHTILSYEKEDNFNELMDEKWQQIQNIFYEKYSAELNLLFNEIKVVFPETSIVTDGKIEKEYSNTLLRDKKNRSLSIHPSWVRTKKQAIEQDFLKTAKEVDQVSEIINNNSELVGCPLELLSRYAKDLNRPTRIEIIYHLQLSAVEDHKVYMEIVKKMEENAKRKAATI